MMTTTTRTEVIETELLDELLTCAAEVTCRDGSGSLAALKRRDLAKALHAILAARSDRRLAEARARVSDLPIEE